MKIEAAQALLLQVTGAPLSPEERCDRAVELAGELLTTANASQTRSERRVQAQLARMMEDPAGKAFTTAMTDSSFRARRATRVADQIIYLLQQLGIPRYLSFGDRWKLRLFKLLGRALPGLVVPITRYMLKCEMGNVILPGERRPLTAYMQRRRSENVRINLNHLGEAILGEEEAKQRLQIYLDDLADPHVEYVSVKISTIYSQLNLLAWDETLEALATRLRLLYRAAMQNRFEKTDGTQVVKFVNLDMEEYRDLHLTVALFQKVLDEPEFLHHSAGIVLQAYLPDSFAIQRQLTEWAMNRITQGGAPIKIRIVKGANLALERVESSFHGWPQPPYPVKVEVDANYKRMIIYGCEPSRARAANLGIGSHNLFDIAYALLLRAEQGVENDVTFEMLEGMAEHLRRVVQAVAGQILLYSPTARQADFQNAVAYLLRRLDENTGPENFLCHAFGLKPNTPAWVDQVQRFRDSCDFISIAPEDSRRRQDRHQEPIDLPITAPFDNEPDTDWALPHNQQWAAKILSAWQEKPAITIPLVIGGQEISQGREIREGEDPSHPGQVAYTVTLASAEDLDRSLDTAQRAGKQWTARSVEQRSHQLAQVAKQIRRHRGDLIGVMVLDGGKRIPEADPEVSEAVDFLEYYRRRLEELHCIPDIQWSSKGSVLVAPPWNFPCAIPTSGIAAALAAGNSVIFKPAPEAALIGWELVQLFWAAGIPKEVLQFLNCVDEPLGSQLIQDPRVDSVILTGGTATARHFYRLRPGIDLMAETGGKNSIIVSDLADRDLAAKTIVQSAFGHSGQKCSAASLAILHKDVYDDPKFLRQLRDAAQSLTVGVSWDTTSMITPLIHPPTSDLQQALTQLEPGEEWLLEPKPHPDNPNLWSPGIKLGTQPGGYTHQTEFFGPVLALIRARNFGEAIAIANDTPYGLTAGLQSLDEREITQWLREIRAGNLYVNRSITGAIVRRQPFGGCKASSFGPGAKVGGPNYLCELMHATQMGDPLDRAPVNDAVAHLRQQLRASNLTPEELRLFELSAASYAYWWIQLSQGSDPSLLIGQDNIFTYRPRPQVILRTQQTDPRIDVMRIVAACLTTATPLEISGDAATIQALQPILSDLIIETEDELCQRLTALERPRIRMLSQPSQELLQAAAAVGGHIERDPVLANGRFELLHYVRELSISIDYHRYGNLGLREDEVRSPLKNL